MRRRRPRRYRFENATPIVLGRRTAARPAQAPTNWVAIGAGVLAVAGLVLWFSLSSRFYVLGARVVGAERLSRGDIYDASGLALLHILWADERAAEASILEQLPSVEWVEVACGLPANCTITVVERSPVLTWRVGDELFWVDDIGEFAPAAEPLAEGWEVRGPLPTDGEGRVEQDVLIALREMDLLGVAPRPVDYWPGRGLVITDGAGWRVVLGQGAGMERRLRVYAVVRAHFLERDIHPRFVDVRFPEAPYYSETNDW